MKAGQRFVEKIRREAEKGDLAKRIAPLLVGEEWPKGSVQAEVDCAEKLSARFRRIQATIPGLSRLPIEEWESMIGTLEEKFSYLPDVLRLVELDRVQQVAQLRSKEPLRQGGQVEFFQMTVARTGRIRLERLKNDGIRTVTVPFVLTNETLERLVDDWLELSREE